MGKAEVVREVRAQRRATLALLLGLEDEAFDLPTALPGWRVREVVAHLVTLDRGAVTGSLLPAVVGPWASTQALEAWNDRQVARWADRPLPELLLGLDRWGRRFLALVRSVPERLYGLPLPTHRGRMPAGWLLWSRAHDEWTHRQDIRRALGLPDEEVDLAGVAGFVLRAVGLDRARAAGRARGTVVLDLEGVPLPAWRFDLATGRFGPVPGDGVADVRLTAPGPAFILAASGRDSFEELRATGHLQVEGDEAVARAFLSGLRVG
jgi:uncharacterized protein (TIGR03083 family)